MKGSEASMWTLVGFDGRAAVSAQVQTAPKAFAALPGGCTGVQIGYPACASGALLQKTS